MIKPKTVAVQIAYSVEDYSSGAPPNLTFTKLLSAEINGEPLPISKTTWNDFLAEAINHASAKLSDLQALKRIIAIKSVTERRGRGYRFIPSIGLSIPPQNANSAWKAASRILGTVHIPATVVFVWYDIENATHPGKTGKLILS